MRPSDFAIGFALVAIGFTLGILFMQVAINFLP
jgi:hypothetical protein